MRWKRNSVSLVSSVTTVMRRPISCFTSMAVSCHAPVVSMANGQKIIIIIGVIMVVVVLLLVVIVVVVVVEVLQLQLQ